MKLIIDTSVIIAVLANEPIKKKLIKLTKGVELLAPTSVHWEIGNAFSAMLKRKRIEIIKHEKSNLHRTCIFNDKLLFANISQ